MIIRTLLIGAPFALLGGGAVAGNELFDTTCSECHFEDDFADETKEEIEDMIIRVKEGTTKHKPSLEALSDEEIQKLAEFFAGQ